MKLDWKNPRIDGYPKKVEAQCLIQVLNSIQLAYWRPDVKEWGNPIYGWLPRIYDDEGSYPAEVTAWAYVPDELFEEINFVPCSCYRPNYYGGPDRCFGTKEIDVCSCKGNKKKCDFYDK